MKSETVIKTQFPVTACWAPTGYGDVGGIDSSGVKLPAISLGLAESLAGCPVLLSYLSAL